ncbi:uncharacterized protein LOC135174821 [Pogoniulus pusillus]|uniref:uncharacterized protein LOC135174821 n=1 Tax=Pogoniulus pusillus TaxID=488313 RepID=UPI0030B9241B
MGRRQRGGSPLRPSPHRPAPRAAAEKGGSCYARDSAAPEPGANEGESCREIRFLPAPSRGAQRWGLFYLQQVQTPAGVSPAGSDRLSCPSGSGGDWKPGTGGGGLARGVTAAPGGHPCSQRAPPPPEQSESTRRRQRLRPPLKGRRRTAGREAGKSRERRETASKEINRHMTVAIRRRPPTTRAYAGEPGKAARRGHTCRRSTYPLGCAQVADCPGWVSPVWPSFFC